LPIPFRPLIRLLYFGDFSPRRDRGSRAMVRYSRRTSASLMPAPSSRTMIGSSVSGLGSVIQTLSASASHALSTSSLSAASVER
jgi:hypothetical protein